MIKFVDKIDGNERCDGIEARSIDAKNKYLEPIPPEAIHRSKNVAYLGGLENGFELANLCD